MRFFFKGISLVSGTFSCLELLIGEMNNTRKPTNVSLAIPKQSGIYTETWVITLESTRTQNKFSKNQSFFSETYGHKGCIRSDVSWPIQIMMMLRTFQLQDSSWSSMTRITKASSIYQWPSLLLFEFCPRAAGSSISACLLSFSPLASIIQSPINVSGSALVN